MPRFQIAALALTTVLAAFAGVPLAAAEDQFGAIAFSPETGSVGWSYNQQSRRQAERAAMGNCRGYADDCRIATYFRNACGAVAQSPDGGWGADWGVDRREAERNAIDACYNEGNSGCRVIRWACTDH
jgi:serine/threonine-protein kinase